VLGGHFRDSDAHRRAAGDRDHLDAGTASEKVPDERARPGDHLVRRPGKPGLFHQPGEAEQRQRAITGGLGDHGVACRERGGSFVGVKFNGVVERHNRRHHAQRLPDRHGQMALLAGHGVHRHNTPEDALGFFGEPPEDPYRGADLFPCLLDWLAVFRCQKLAERFLVGGHRLRDAVQNRGSYMRRALTHGFFAALRRLQCPRGVLQRCERDSVDDLAGSRIDHLLPATIRGFDPFAVDQHLHGGSSMRAVLARCPRNTDRRCTTMTGSPSVWRSPGLLASPSARIRHISLRSPG